MKIGKDVTSRGYCGWYKTKEGKNVYLRSRLEFIVASFLDINEIVYETECITYETKNGKYKPDFFIFRDKKIKCIIEVKYSDLERLEYLNLYYDYFKSKKIKYFVFSNKHINRLEKKYGLSGLSKKWIEESAKIKHDMRGSKNPHYGMKHSDKSKKLIGKKTKERCLNKEYINRFSKSISKSMNEERKRKIGEKTKERFKNVEYKRKFSESVSKYIKKIGIRECLNCKKSFEVYYCYNKKTGKFEKYMSINMYNTLKGDFCSSNCSNVFLRKKQVKEKMEKQIELYRKFIFEKGYKPNRKKFLTFCKKYNVSGDIRSTFKTFSNFNNYMEEEDNG